MEINKNELNEQLMKAVIAGDIDAATDSLINGADLFIETTKGNNLLYVAATRKQEEMFDWLLEVEKSDKKLDINKINHSGTSLLFDLVKNEGLDYYIKKLLENGANPNIVNSDKKTPLIQACADKKVPIIEMLLKHNVDVNYMIEESGTTAFSMAASQSSMSICKLLVDSKVDINKVDSFGKNVLINTIFKTDTFLKKAEKRQHKELCDFLVDSGIDLNYVAPTGMTAIWAAATMGLNDLVKKMIDKGANVDVWHDLGLSGNMSMLHIWCQRGDQEMIDLCLQKGAKLGVVDDIGNKPEAYGFMHPKLREYLFDQGADVNSIFHTPKSSTQQSQRTPIISLVINSGNTQKDLVQKMIDKGAKVYFEDQDLQSVQPILLAIAASATDILKSLLNTKQVNLNTLMQTNPNSEGLSPLISLVAEFKNQALSNYLKQKDTLEAIVKGKEENDKNGVKSDLISDEAMKEIENEILKIKGLESNIQKENEQIFDILIKEGADVNLKTEESQQTALFYAKTKFYAEKLIKNGADINVVNKDGNTPLINALLTGKKEVFEYFKEIYPKENITKLFYDLAFQQEAKNSYMIQNMVEKAIYNLIGDNVDWKEFNSKENKDKVYNINIESDIGYVDEDGNTPLLVACANDLPFLVSLLYRFGADVNKPNNNGEYPIMHALGTENYKLVEFLVNHGADVSVRTQDGENLIDLAKNLENKQILNFLEETLENKKDNKMKM